MNYEMEYCEKHELITKHKGTRCMACEWGKV